MAQRPTADFNIDPNITSGTDLANILNRFQDAIDSGNSGTSRPAYLEAGGLWVQTGNPMRLFFYDGTTDRELYNTTDGLVTGIDDGTEAGQLTVWDGSDWTPNSSLTIKGGNATFSGNVGIGRDTNSNYQLAIQDDIQFGGTNAGLFCGKHYTDADAPTGKRSFLLGFVSGTSDLYLGGEPNQSYSGSNSDVVMNAQNLKFQTNGVERLNIADTGDATFSQTVNANQFVDANGPIISAFTMVKAFRKIKSAVADETTVEGIKESLTNVLGGLIEEFESIGTQES